MFAFTSTLNDSGVVPSILSISDYIIHSIRIIHVMFFCAFVGLNPQKAYEPQGVPIIFP